MMTSNRTQRCNWARALKPNDAVDIFDDDDQQWYPGTLIQQQRNWLSHKKYYDKLLIEYNDASDKTWHEWVIMHMTHLSPCHDKYQPKLRIHPTINLFFGCTRKVAHWRCLTCKSVLFAGYAFRQNICKDCMTNIEFEYLFQSIHSSVYPHYQPYVDMNIILLITGYSMGIVLCCSSYMCSKSIVFASKTDFVLNLALNKQCKQSIYQYSPVGGNYFTTNRIFCKGCTKTQIQECFLCDTFEMPHERIYMDYNRRYMRYEAESVCYKHAKCKECSFVSRYSYTRRAGCNECGCWYCYDCRRYYGTRCPQCTEQRERNKIVPISISRESSEITSATDSTSIDECEGQENEWLMSCDFNIEYVLEKRCNSRKFQKMRDWRSEKYLNYWRNVENMYTFNVKHRVGRHTVRNHKCKNKKKRHKNWERKRNRTSNVITNRASHKRWVLDICTNHF
eukprot:760472_1